MKVRNLTSLFPVIDNPVITRLFLFVYLLFLLSLTGKNKITLVIFMEKSFFKNVFNRFIFQLSSINLVKASVFLDDFNCNIYVNVK